MEIKMECIVCGSIEEYDPDKLIKCCLECNTNIVRLPKMIVDIFRTAGWKKLSSKPEKE